MGPGHPIGDFLQAHEWTILDERPGYFRLDVHLIDAAKNYRGQLFGGFAPTYVDLVSLRTVSAGEPLDAPRGWLVTVNMRLDYFEPVEGPRFFLECEIKNRRGSIILAETRFKDDADRLLIWAVTTLKELPIDA